MWAGYGKQGNLRHSDDCIIAIAKSMPKLNCAHAVAPLLIGQVYIARVEPLKDQSWAGPSRELRGPGAYIQ